MPSFKIRVTKNYTVFCAGPFITYEGDKCEPLHGHNYHAASIEGELETALRGVPELTALEVEVEEAFGQSAFCRRELNR